MKTRHIYPKKFKDDAVRRYRKGGITHRKLAEELGVNVYTLRAWIWYAKPVKGTETASVARTATKTALQAEAEALRRENQALQRNIRRLL
jgi:transposase-like protein